MADTTTTTASGAFKTVYANAIEDLAPESDLFHKDFKFIEPSKREGSEYKQPVQVNREMGFTLDNTGDAFTLLGAVSRTIPTATINGATYVGQSAMSYDAMQKALKVGQSSGSRAFINMTKDTVENMVKTASFVAEIQYRYGCGSSASSDATGGIDSLGEVATVSDSSGTNTITLTNASWATAIWVGNEGMRLDCYDSDGTQRNTNATLELQSVSPSTRTIVVTGNTSDTAAIAVGDYFHFRSSYEKQMTGLGTILQNTGSLFGINAATYNLWAGSSFDASGVLTMGKLLQAANRPANLGYRGTLCAYTNPASWQDLMTDEAALVQHAADGGYKEGYERGAESIKFHSQTGTLEIKSDIYMKRGFTMLLPKDKVLRVGASDFTFEMPTGEAGNGGKIIREMDSAAGTELRGYWNQGIFLPTPAFGTLITGITPTADAA